MENGIAAFFILQHNNCCLFDAEVPDMVHWTHHQTNDACLPGDGTQSMKAM